MKKHVAGIVALAGIGLLGGAMAQPTGTDWKDWGGTGARMN